jgi:hypothetical protein
MQNLNNNVVNALNARYTNKLSKLLSDSPRTQAMLKMLKAQSPSRTAVPTATASAKTSPTDIVLPGQVKDAKSSPVVQAMLLSATHLERASEFQLDS